MVLFFLLVGCWYIDCLFIVLNLAGWVCIVPIVGIADCCLILYFVCLLFRCLTIVL